jgi:hypothetical protein
MTYKIFSEIPEGAVTVRQFADNFTKEKGQAGCTRQHILFNWGKGKLKDIEVVRVIKKKDLYVVKTTP